MTRLEEEIREIRIQIEKLEYLLEQKLEELERMENEGAINISVEEFKEDLMENFDFDDVTIGVTTNIIFFDENIHTIQDVKRKMKNTTRKFNLRVIVKGYKNEIETLYYNFDCPFNFEDICTNGTTLEDNVRVRLKYDHFQEIYYSQVDIVDPNIVNFKIKRKDLMDYKVIQEGSNEPLEAIINKRSK